MSMLGQELVQIDIKYLSYDEVMLPKEESAGDLDQTMFIRFSAINTHKDFGFDLSIFSLASFILTDFDGDKTATFLHISAL